MRVKWKQENYLRGIPHPRLPGKADTQESASRQHLDGHPGARNDYNPISMRALEPSLLKEGLRKALRTSWVLVRVILPTYMAADLLRATPVIPALGQLFGPLMHPLGLPGEAAMALVLGCTVNLYAAVGILASLKLTAGQVAVCGLMLGIAHALVIEAAVLRTIGTRYLTLTLYRLVMAALVGLAAAPLLTRVFS
jgi:hypothetical protein